MHRPLALFIVSLMLGAAAPGADLPADLILRSGRIWTAEAEQPWAEALAVRGDRIIAVGSSAQVLRLKGAQTRMVDLHGRMVVPGFIDAHTHFELATSWFFEAGLVDVDDEPTLIERLKGRLAQVPADFWITGVDWGGMTARRKWSAGDRSYTAFEPHLAAVDALAPDRPILLQRHDGAVFANSEALRRLRLRKEKPDPTGGAYGRDAGTGQLTGMLYGSAATAAWTSLPPKSEMQTRVAALAILKQLNAVGITGIHDIARIDALSQQTVYRTNVERSHSDLNIFEDLRRRGDLTVRVYAMLPLRNFRGLAALGVQPGSGDSLIRFGGLKAFIDGYLLDEPWRNHPEYSGDFTMRVIDEATMQDDVVAADKAGFDVGMHAFGDKAHRLMLNWYEAAIAANPPRDRRFRLIHAWWPALPEIVRAGRMHAVADITPMQMIEDRKQVETMLSPSLQRTSFAWRTLIENGVRLNIGSDLPGSFDRSDIMPFAPLENIYYAVTRHRIGEPASAAWRPDQALTVEEALKAYTINPAWTSHEEKIKGSIAPGKLADLVVLSADVTRGPPERLLSTHIVWTLLGGRTVAGAPPSPAAAN